MKSLTSTLCSLLFSAPFLSTSLALPASDTIAAKTSQTLPLPITIIHEFPPQTWVENLAVKSCGNILVTLLTSPDIYQIDPSQQTSPILVHSFPPYRGLLGIAELEHNIFYVAASNFSLDPAINTTNAWAIFKLDVTNGPTKAQATKIADFPKAGLLNGVTVLNRAAGTILIADSGAGVVYRLNVRTGRADKVIDDPTMKAVGAPPIGVNGLKIRDGNLFFTNGNQGIFVRIPIKSTGEPSGPTVVLSRDIKGADDFILDSAGNEFIAENGQNNLAFLRSTGGNTTILAGAPLEDPTLLAGPSAVAFGRLHSDKKSLYITTTAGLASGANRSDLGGTVSRVDLEGTGYYNKGSCA